MIGDNNHLAVGLLVSIPLMNYLRMESRHAIIRYGLLATMALTLFAVVGSYSRGALLALGAVSGYFWLKSSKKLISGMLLAIALVTAITFMPAKLDRSDEYDRDVPTGYIGDEPDWRSGTLAWSMAVSAAAGRRWVLRHILAARRRSIRAGRGVLGRFTASGSRCLGEHGFPTFFVWVGIIFAGAVYARRIIKTGNGRAGT